ncbi:MAG: DNA-3-methyladenine glycosylase 2 family protein [Microbacteriaceae bacterium]|nr:DNA-3-methyladenine glycosylase 2 family protein [Microbacteriaceae bacterium]
MISDATSAFPLTATPAPTPTTTLQLLTRPPFDGAGIMRFFADHAISGVEDWSIDSYRRALSLPRGNATIEVKLCASGIECRARLSSPDDQPHLEKMLRRLFDLDADSALIDTALAHHPGLGGVVRANPGVRLPGSIDAHETLFRTLLGQQVSVAAARTVLGRVCRELTDGSGLFPTAAQFAERGTAVLRGPVARVASIVALAEALASGSLIVNDRMSPGELTRTLLGQRGIGPWTAGYVAMRVLGSPDILLSSDLIMVQSARKLGLAYSARELALLGERWAPWRSYAGLQLWRAANR